METTRPKPTPEILARCPVIHEGAKFAGILPAGLFLGKRFSFEGNESTRWDCSVASNPAATGSAVGNASNTWPQIGCFAMNANVTPSTHHHLLRITLGSGYISINGCSLKSAHAQSSEHGWLPRLEFYNLRQDPRDP